MKKNKVFQERLYEVAAKNGLSLQDFADAIGVHKNSIYRIKTYDDVWLSVPTLMKIAKLYEVDLNWLFGVTDENPYEPPIH